jgi:uncharacterized phage protein gp47/JayE
MSVPIEKTLDDVRSDLFGRLEATQAEYVQKGWMPSALNLNKGVVRGLVELWAWGLYALYRFMVVVLGQAFPETATGKWLDLHCAQVGVSRKAKTKTSGKVVFGRSGTSGNVLIPAGRIVRTLPDGLGRVYRFMTTADVVLQDGTSEVSVPVVAEAYGSGSNVTAGQICEITTHIPGVDTVENRSGWITSEGADDEGDEALRNRYRLAWMDVNGATKYAYESWALSITGVVGCSILDRHPRGAGTVDVIVLGEAGIPTESLLAKVRELVLRNKPINDDVEVRGPVPVSVEIDGELELSGGVSDQVSRDVEAALRALFKASGTAALGVGEDVTLDRLTACAMSVSGVKRVTWRMPVSDVAIPKDGLGVLGGIHLDTVWESEP